MPDELVGLVDERGRPAGTAPRSLVRRANLRHQATAVLVRDPSGRVYVHRRTDTKDVYPGAHDCWAGGVVLAGERPDDAARRELAEELGIDGVPLRAAFRRWYVDEGTSHPARASRRSGAAGRVAVQAVAPAKPPRPATGTGRCW